MNRRRNLITIVSLSMMLIFPFPSISAPEADETVTKRGSVNDDYYATGGIVDVDANIAGDIVVSGGELFLGKKIMGDVIAAGGTIHLRGEMQDDVRIAGGEINIDAQINDDLAAAGGEVRVSSATTINGEAWIAGGDIYMAGKANKGLSMAAGNIRLSGIVRGNVDLEGGEIHILEGAVIDGDLHYKSPNEATIHPAAKITGKITYEQTDWDHPHRGYGIFFSLTMIVAALVLFGLFPNFTMSAAGRISTDPWKNIGAGFGLLVITPIAAVLFMGLVLGIWVGLIIMALYFVSLVIALLISCFFLGDWGARLLNKNISTSTHRLVSVSLAIISLGLIQLIPVVGGLLTCALVLLGLGAGILQLHFVYKQSGGV